jgi:CheY-like chemotaxis protein
VALDFNNALTIILGHTSLMLRKLEATSPWRKSLLEIEKAAGKAAEIANDLATFSRQEKDSRGQTAGNLNALLRRVVEMFQKQSDKRVVWTLHLERNLFGTSYDEAKMQQAIARVLENAVQALGANGRVSVESRNLEVDEPLKDRNVDLAPGLYLCVEITDNGIGIAPDVLPRVFEPFFTTKPDHRGLGLAWAYGIVTNHGGLIALQSVPGQGTTARIYLPATRRVVRDSDVQEAELTGYQTILVVDDEDLLLTLAETVLSDYGYRVLTANSGQKALEHIAVAERPIDLLITDLVMPQMSGRELIEQVRHFSPTTRIIFSSGYVRPPGAEEEENFLRKPFTAQELLLKVREALS